MLLVDDLKPPQMTEPPGSDSSILHANLPEFRQICLKMYGFPANMRDSRKYARIAQICLKMVSFQANLRELVKLFIEHSSLGSNESKHFFEKL